jgi:hypothetical protein
MNVTIKASLAGLLFYHAKNSYIYIYNKVNIHYLETKRRRKASEKRKVTLEFGG